MEKGKTKNSSKKKGLKKHGESKRRKRTNSSSEENIDMSEEVFPIAHYIDDREEMIKQAFSVMEREKLNCMLPPILKGLSMQALMGNCLKELKNMSDDEVFRVLHGELSDKMKGQESAASLTNSDSRERQSSPKNTCSEDREKRTLLDILEQEMQEIAYNTVLSKDNAKSPPSSPDSEFLEIVAIKPRDSPSKSERDVPLICIDSDEEQVSKTDIIHDEAEYVTETRTTNSKSESILRQADEYLTENSTRDSDAEVLSRKSPCSISYVTETSDASNKSEMNGVAKSRNFNDNQDTQKTVQDVGSSTNLVSHEPRLNFVIKVVTDTNCVTERIVQQLSKPCLAVQSSSNETQDLDKTSFSRRSCHEDVDLSSLERLSSGEECQKIVPKNNDEVEIVKDQSVRDAPIPPLESNLSQVHRVEEEPLIPQSPDLCAVLQDSMPSGKIQNSQITDQPDTVLVEKEEGEISEESEGDVEILETVRERDQSPTVLLSTSDGEDKSVRNKGNEEVKVRKHLKHRRRKKCSSESMRRTIDKRGNRSYRRKISPSRNQSHSPVKYLLIEEIPLPPENAHHLPTMRENTSTGTSDLPSLTEDASPSQVSEVLSPKPSPGVESASDSCENSTHGTTQELTTLPSSGKSSPCSGEISLSGGKLDSVEEIQSDSSEPSSTKTSWADRWAQKKDMKKVVITSKICRNVRKRILSARQNKSSQETPLIESAPLPPVPPLVLHVEGSVQEYQMLQFLASDDVPNAEHQQQKTELENIELPTVIPPEMFCDDTSRKPAESKPESNENGKKPQDNEDTCS